jgi:serine/alanine adding enzyme
MKINTNPDRLKWNNYVWQHPLGTIFQTSLMYDIYQSAPGYEGGVISLEDQDTGIQGMLVYVLLYERGVNKIFSKRAIITGGPLVTNNNEVYADLLLSNFVALVKKAKAIYTEVRNIYDVSALNPCFDKYNFKYGDHLNIHVHLDQPVIQLHKGLHKKRAGNIRRALKKNVIVKDLATEEDVLMAYQMIHKTYCKINLPSPPVELFLTAFRMRNDGVKCLGAYLNDKLIGCRIYLIYKERIYDWYASVDRNFSGYHAGDLLPWSTMLWARENNLKCYDFAGAGKPKIENTVRDYKLKFGGTVLNFGRYTLVHKPFFYQIGLFGLKMYRYFK